MVGRIICYRERGRGGLRQERLGGLTLMTGELYAPPGLPQWRLRRRLARLERSLTALGIGRVVLSEGFPMGAGWRSCALWRRWGFTGRLRMCWSWRYCGRKGWNQPGRW